MKQIFKYIFITIAATLAISSCHEEMVGPGGEEMVPVSGRISSVSAQRTAVKSTEAVLDSYYATLNGEFLPEFTGAVNDLDTSADEIGSVTAAIGSIMEGVDPAVEALEANIATLKGFVPEHQETKDLYTMTEASLLLHSQLSESLAEVPARVEAVLTLIQILAAEDKEKVAPVYEKLSSQYESLLSQKTEKLKTSMNAWLGEGVLPNYYDKARQSKLVEILKAEIDLRKMAILSGIKDVLAAMENPEAETITDEQYDEILLAAAGKNNGKLNDSVTSQVSKYNTGISTQVTEVNKTFQMFRSSAAESVALLAPIQSVVYASTFAENLVYARYSSYSREKIELNFIIRPEEVASVLVENWEQYMTLQAFNPTQGVTLMDTPPSVSDVSLNGDMLTVYVDPTNVPGSVYNGGSKLNLILDLNNGVRKIATEDFIQLKPKVVPGISMVSDGIGIVKGEIKSIEFYYSPTSNAEVIIEPNQYIGSATISYLSNNQGRIRVLINEGYDVDLQNATLTVTDTSTGESTSRVITFKEVGYFNVSVPYILPASGGTIKLNWSGNITGGAKSEVTSGANWLSPGSVSHSFEATENLTEYPRTATVQYTVGSHTKEVYISQYGTSNANTTFEMYLGSWTLKATDAFTGLEVERKVQFTRDINSTNGYLVTGLANGSNTVPVKMTYNAGTVSFSVPQQGLNGSSLGAYRVSRSGNIATVNPTPTQFNFTWDGTYLRGNNMTNSDSFMYMSEENGSYTPDAADNEFLYDVVLEKTSIVMMTDGVLYDMQRADPTLEYPLNIFVLGDGYLASAMQYDGVGGFHDDVKRAVDAIFSYEPFASYRDRFNVYVLPYASAEEGTDLKNGNDNTIHVYKDTRYESSCFTTGNTLAQANYSIVKQDIKNATKLATDDEVESLLAKSLVILLINTDQPSGTCAQVSNGTTIDSNVSGDGFKQYSVSMVAAKNMNMRSLTVHEAGGHGFGRLGDEYVSTSGGTFEGEALTTLLANWSKGLYMNVSPYNNENAPGYWWELSQLPIYQNAGLGFYQSAYNYQYGIYRPENGGMMVDSKGRFNAVSRHLIFRRIVMTTQPSIYNSDEVVYNAFLEYDKKNVAAESVTLDKGSLTLNVNGTSQLNAELAVVGNNRTTNPASGLVWSSSDQDVVTISSSGLVTAVGSGSATITVQTDDGIYGADGRRSATCSVTVQNPVSGVSLSAGSLSFSELNTTQSLTLNVTGQYSNISWTSSSTGVATVSGNGTQATVTAKGDGSATITATVTSVDGSTHTANCSVTVSSERKTPAVGDYVYNDGSWSDGTKAVESGKTVIGLVCYLGSLSSDELLATDYNNASNFNCLVVGLSDKSSKIYNGDPSKDFYKGNDGSIGTGNNTINEYNWSSSTPSKQKMFGYTLFRPFFLAKGWAAVNTYMGSDWQEILNGGPAISGASRWYPAGMAEYAAIYNMQDEGDAAGRTGYNTCSGTMATLYIDSRENAVTKGYVWGFDFSTGEVSTSLLNPTERQTMRKVFAMQIQDK